MTRQVPPIPNHLKAFVIDQSEYQYTATEHAIWRFILRKLSTFLQTHAHESYEAGLQATGITIDKIPQIADMNEKLAALGWQAVPVSGFIPPAAFMEFQALGYLPIACEIRQFEHLRYTPAPDIVHEAAGHAPMLVNPDYSEYLAKYAQIAKKCILSSEDLALYEAIRLLSDLKEKPDATTADIAEAEQKLNFIKNNLSHISEAQLVSRMNWWTAEYGLIGSTAQPRIFGAGLLSSIGEAQHYLDTKVKKLALTAECVDFSYDITQPQPQLFVARDFAHLSEVLEEFARRLAYQRGGKHGLEQAFQSNARTTIELDSGLQISGVLKIYEIDDASNNPCFIKLDGRCQLATNYVEIDGHGFDRHSHGYSTPLGEITNMPPDFTRLDDQKLAAIGWKTGHRVELIYASGIKMSGVLKNMIRIDKHLALATFSDCLVKKESSILYDPSWGDFDLALGTRVVSVFGGLADTTRSVEDALFKVVKIARPSFSPAELALANQFEAVQNLRSGHVSMNNLSHVFDNFMSEGTNWLLGLDILELLLREKLQAQAASLKQKLSSLNLNPDHQACLRDGFDLLNLSF